MNEKYEEKLWGQVDILHLKAKRQQISFNYLMDMLNKFQESCSDFSKNIQSILTKTHEIIEYHSTSMHDSAEKFVQLYETFPKEFKEIQNSIKTQILDPILKPTNEEFNKEKEYYNNYSKFRSQYNSSKISMEKCQKNYENNMKLCENSVFNSKHMNALLYVKEDEKIKNTKNANNSIKSTKTFEEKYLTSLENVNKARENEINKQTALLKFYQKLDINFYEKVKLSIGLYLAIINKMCQTILKSAELLGKSYEQISVEKDINDFISKNKVEKKVQEISKFIPYMPFSDPTNKKEDSNKLDIYFEVIKALKKNFKDIRLDINMEEETKRKRLRYLSEKIFKFGNNVVFTPEEKNELMGYLENESFRNYFIVVLTKQRTKGRFKRAESLVRDLSDLLLKILEISENIKDYDTAKNCIILSQTYYFEEKIENKKKKDNKNDTGKKIYLLELIKNNKWLKNVEFWTGLISLMIEKEIKKNEESNNNQGIEDNEKIKKSRLSNICFSQLLTFSTNMLDFGMDKKDINTIVEDFSKKYEISKELKDTIYGSLEIKQQELAQATNKGVKDKDQDLKKEGDKVKEKEKNKDKEINKNDEKKEESININKENDKNIEKIEDKDKIQENNENIENIEKKEEIKKINVENKVDKENNEEKENLEQKQNEENKEIMNIKEQENKNEINQTIEDSELKKVEEKQNDEKKNVESNNNIITEEQNNEINEEKVEINRDNKMTKEAEENDKKEEELKNEIKEEEKTKTNENDLIKEGEKLDIDEEKNKEGEKIDIDEEKKQEEEKMTIGEDNKKQEEEKIGIDEEKKQEEEKKTIDEDNKKQEEVNDIKEKNEIEENNENNLKKDENENKNEIEISKDETS